MIRLFGRLFAPDDRGLRLVTVEDGRVRAIEPAERPSWERSQHDGMSSKAMTSRVVVECPFTDGRAELVDVAGSQRRFVGVDPNCCHGRPPGASIR
jgi:hypothetical protein